MGAICNSGLTPNKLCARCSADSGTVGHSEQRKHQGTRDQNVIAKEANRLRSLLAP